MAISRVPGSRKSLKLFGYPGLQARRKRACNLQFELLDDRVPPNNLRNRPVPCLASFVLGWPVISF